MGFSLKTWLAIAGALAIVAAIVGLKAYFDFLELDRDRWKATAVQAQGEWSAWSRRAIASEKLRAGDNAKAKAAATQDARACQVRVDAARRSAAAIASITGKEPTLDQTGRPVRELVPPGRLRDALRPSN